MWRQNKNCSTKLWINIASNKVPMLGRSQTLRDICYHVFQQFFMVCPITYIVICMHLSDPKRNCFIFLIFFFIKFYIYLLSNISITLFQSLTINLLSKISHISNFFFQIMFFMHAHCFLFALHILSDSETYECFQHTLFIYP